MNGEQKLWAIFAVCAAAIAITFIILASLYPKVWLGP